MTQEGKISIIFMIFLIPILLISANWDSIQNYNNQNDWVSGKKDFTTNPTIIMQFQEGNITKIEWKIKSDDYAWVEVCYDTNWCKFTTGNSTQIHELIIEYEDKFIKQIEWDVSKMPDSFKVKEP